MNEIVSVNTTPLVSVVMSLYNSEQYLNEAIDSVLSQTLADFEFIIIDDGSNDAGAKIVHTYNDPRIHLISQKNAGLPTALNRAISEAKGQLIARMDPDDCCMPERLARQYDYLLHHQEVAIVGTAATCIDENGGELADIQMIAYIGVGEITLPESPCIHPSVMFRRTAFDRAGGYPEKMRFGGEDAVLFNRIISFAAVANLPETLLFYRLSHTSMSQKSKEFNLQLRQIVRKEFLDEVVSESEWQQLSNKYKLSGSGWFGYHLYVGKLFLSDDGNKSRARSHLLKALKAKPLSSHTWLCILFSYIPSVWQTTLLFYLKKSKKPRS